MRRSLQSKALRRAFAASALAAALVSSAAVTPTGAQLGCGPVIHVDIDNDPGVGPPLPPPFGLSWADAFWDLNSAINQANSCAGTTTQIWIAEGTYNPHPTDPTVSFILPGGIRLIGGFDGTELAPADRPQPLAQVSLNGFLPNDRSHHVVVVEAGDRGALEDLTIEGGNASGINGAPSNGGGIFVEDFNGDQQFSSLLAYNVTIKNNDAANNGGGVYAGGPVVIDGSITDNSAASNGGGVYFRFGLSFFYPNLERNSANNGGGFFTATDALVLTSEGVVADNRATSIGGAIFSAGSRLTIDATQFNNNTAGGSAGAIHHSGDLLEIGNSIFVRNEADGPSGNGGALSVFGPATVRNSTFFENSATTLFGAIYVGGNPEATLDLQNSIIWNNSAAGFPQMRQQGGGTTRNSDIEGSGGSGPGWSANFGIDGGGNIDADPLFSNVSFPYLMPTGGSPVADAGDAAFSPIDTFDRNANGNQGDLSPDLDGNPRLQGSGLDMGAYEIATGAANQFTTLPRPCVVYNSAAGQGSIAGPIDGGETRQLNVRGDLSLSQGGDANGCAPLGTTSVTFAVSAQDPTGFGNLQMSEANVAPSGGVVNFAPNGLNNANTITIPVSSSGTFDLTGNGGPGGLGQPLTDVRLMAIGYVGPSGAERFVPITPCAFGDSRPAQEAEGQFEGPFGPGTTLTYDYVGTFSQYQGGGVGGDPTCGIPSGIDSLIVNVVAVAATGGEGSVIAHPTTELPVEGTPFAPIGLNNAAVAVVPVSGDTINVTIEGQPDSSTHVRLVALGYMSSAGGSTFTPVNPCAAFDTRSSQGSSGSFAGLRQGGQTTTYSIAGPIDPTQGGNNGSCGVPPGVDGVLLNLVAVGPVGAGNLQVSAAGAAPSGGVLNFAALSPSMNNSNAVPVELNGFGEIDVFVNGGTSAIGLDRTHVRGVVLGYYID